MEYVFGAKLLIRRVIAKIIPPPPRGPPAIVNFLLLTTTVDPCFAYIWAYKNMLRRQQLTREQALQKARHYCAYQERCHSEVKEKLYSFGLGLEDVEESLSQLIEENYLNEERYAVQYAGGRFRLKHWGRVKIRYELRQKLVSEYNIGRALAAIGEETYLGALEKLAADKWEALEDEKDVFTKKHKVQGYLLQKGYESDLIGRALAEMKEKN